jgi:hypothetical protein
MVCVQNVPEINFPFGAVKSAFQDSRSFEHTSIEIIAKQTGTAWAHKRTFRAASSFRTGPIFE